MTELPQVETLTPPPNGFSMIPFWPFLRHNRVVSRIIMTLTGGLVLALARRPPTDLFDEMTAAIRERRMRHALLTPPSE